MHGRGDLRGQRAAFKVKLDKPNPLALQAENPLERLGLNLRRDAASSRLLVADVDKHPRKKTPVAHWNCEEERRANRSEEERHASFALLPGDRLRAINDINGGTAMLTELVECMSFTSPKAVDLAISRNISDVLMLPPQRSTSGDAPAPIRPPRLRQQADCTKLPATPPRTPPINVHSGSNSRAASAGSSRSRSGSRCSSMRKSYSSARGIDVSLSHAGRLCLAF